MTRSSCSFYEREREREKRERKRKNEEHKLLREVSLFDR